MTHSTVTSEPPPAPSLRLAPESTLQVVRHHLWPALVLACVTGAFTTHFLWWTLTGSVDTPIAAVLFSLTTMLVLLALVALPVVTLVRGLRRRQLWCWTWTFAVVMPTAWLAAVCVSAVSVRLVHTLFFGV